MDHCSVVEYHRRLHHRVRREVRQVVGFRRTDHLLFHLATLERVVLRGRVLFQRRLSVPLWVALFTWVLIAFLVTLVDWLVTLGRVVIRMVLVPLSLLLIAREYIWATTRRVLERIVLDESPVQIREERIVRVVFLLLVTFLLLFAVQTLQRAALVDIGRPVVIVLTLLVAIVAVVVVKPLLVLDVQTVDSK